jgi:HK97 family phage portal protein
MSSEERVVSDLVWTPERGSETPEVRGISWENFLLSDDKYLGKWKTDSGIRITPETALQSTIVLACCRILAETVSGLPLHVYRRSPDGGDEIAKEIPLYKVLTFRPNEWQTKQEFFEQIVMTLALWGNSYTRIRSGQYGSVSQLDNLHPSRMEVERLENGRLRYSYTDPETGRLERYTQDQIMHCRWTPEQDGIKGMVPVEIAREAIGLARACEQHAARFWANSARPGVVLQTEGTLNAEAAERLRDNWERLHRGSERAFRTAVLTGGMKAVELGMTNESSQFVASRDFQTAEICRVYRIPQHLIQGTPGGDLEVQGQEFVTYTLMPWLSRIESSISRSLIYNDDEFYAKFDVRGLLRANSQQRASYYSTMTSLGIMTINDCRRAEGLKPLGPIGDHHFVAMNMQTLEDATKPKPEAPAGGMPGGGGGDGPPPPTPGGPPSLPEVKTGKAPIESPKGEASKPKEEPQPQMEEAIEEASAELEDAVEDRAFCSTGPGGGIDNSCGAKVMAGPDKDSGGGAASSGTISAKDADEKFERYRPFVSVGDSKNSDFIRVPSDEEIASALDKTESKQGKIGGSRELSDDTPVALRIDIPAWNNSEGKTYVVTVHEGKNPDNKKPFGKPIGYDSLARLSGPVSFLANDEDRAQEVAEGKSKTPLATVNGSFSKSREIPADIDSWTPVGYDPQKAVYFYDKRTGREVIGGTDALSAGNTVFTREPEYGPRNAKTHYRSADEMFACDSWGLESRAWCPTGPGGGLDNSCGAKVMSAPDGSGGGSSGNASEAKDKTQNRKRPKDYTPDTVPKVPFSVTDDGEAFLAARDKSSMPENFSELSRDVLDSSTKYLSADGKSGCLLTQDGDLGNVFNNGGPSGAGVAAVLTAIESGAQTLDCYEDFLPRLYSQVGFVATAKMRWNDDYAPPNWDYNEKGRPDVIIMSYQGGDRSTIRQRVGSFKPYEELPDDKYTADFDAAKRTARLSSDPQRRSASVLRSRDRDAGRGEGLRETRSHEGPDRVHQQSVDTRAFCATGDGGGIDNSCGVGDDDAPSDAFGNAIDAAMRTPSSSTGGGVGAVWKKLDTPSVYNGERLKSNPPSKSLAEVNTVTIFNGRTLSASLKEVGVTLDQAAKVCGNLSPESNIAVAHGNLKDITSWIDDPSRATDPASSVTVVSKQPFGGVEDAIGTAATLSRTEDDELLLSYVMFSVAPEAQKDNPIAVARNLYSGVVKSINEAEKVGVEEVGMLAAGSESNDEYKGYRIWPRLGFDGIIPRNRITPTYSLRLGFFEKYGSNLPDEILSDRAKQEKSEGALTIQSLYDTKEGQRWWEANGGPMGMFLRVGDNEDPGWQRFKKISDKVSDRDIIDVIDVEWRSIRGEAEERGFCATGPGGGIDNSCGVNMAPDRDMGSSVAAPSAGAGKPASVTVESQGNLDKAAASLGLSGVDDVVTLGGGNVRGAKVDVYGDESGFVKVSSIWPIDKEDPRGGGKVFTEVSMANTPEGKVLGFEAFGPSEGSVATGASQQKVMSIISEKVAESIDAAEKHGFVAVTTFAVGDANNEYKGYRLWPQFGFDADLPRDLAKRVPPEIVLKSKGIAIPPPGSTSIPHHIVVKSLASQHRDLTIQELLKTREGDRWWDENGDDIELKLDLTDKSSLGYQRWEKMKDRLPRLRERNQTRGFFDAFVEERGFCPTGEGGGIDNSCGNDDGGPTDAFGGSIGGFSRSPSATKEKKGGGGGGSANSEPLVWRAGEPHIDIFRESVQNNPTTRDETGKVVATAIPGGVVTRALAGKYEVSPVAVGRYLMSRQSEERGRPISTRVALEGDDFEYMVSAIADQAKSAIARGVSPNFYSPEDRKSQLDEYSKLQPLMLGGRTASGVCIGEEDADGNCKGGEGIHPHAEFLFRAAQALTSPEANPYENMRRANEVLNSFFNEPDPKKARLGAAVDIAGASGDNIRNQLGRIQSIIDRIGLEETARLFSGPPVRVGDLDEYFTSRIPNSDGESFSQKDYAVDEYAPPFSIFGPKVGPFFANNMGDPDPLTADVWFTRTWGRLSGELIEKTSPDLAKKHATQLMEQTTNIKRNVLAEIGHDGRTFRTDVAQMKKTGVIPQSVVNWAEKQFKQAEKDGFPGPDKGTGTAERKRLDNLAKAILKNQTRVLKAPSTTVMRANMIRVMKEASARTGVPVAYLQDILWQDEQDAWGTLGSRTTTVPGEPSLYSTVIKKLVDDIKSGRPAKEEKPSRRKGKRSYDELDLDEEETGYLSDYKGGIEQALFDEAVHEVDADTFAEIAIEFLRRYQPESRSAIESARDVVVELRSAGLTKIVMQNAGREGLHVMGFDADIPKDIAETLPETLSHCKTLLDLHVSSEGRSWWEQNGREIDVAIDLEGVQGQIFDGFATGKTFSDIIEEGILDDYGNS